MRDDDADAGVSALAAVGRDAAGDSGERRRVLDRAPLAEVEDDDDDAAALLTEDDEDEADGTEGFRGAADTDGFRGAGDGFVDDTDGFRGAGVGFAADDDDTEEGFRSVQDDSGEKR